jgi:hypothetical protein
MINNVILRSNGKVRLIMNLREFCYPPFREGDGLRKLGKYCNTMHDLIVKLG